jgi:pimeloyl-ACP methyl ester carboxylesterase
VLLTVTTSSCNFPSSDVEVEKRQTPKTYQIQLFLSFLTPQSMFTCCLLLQSLLPFLLYLLIVYGTGGEALTVKIQSKSWDFRGHHIGYEEAVLAADDDCNDDNNRSTMGRALGRDDDSLASNNNIPVLLLNGFGVGSFHQHRLFPHLARATPVHEFETLKDKDFSSFSSFSSSSCGDIVSQQLATAGLMGERKVYGIDYLGQGRSWPRNCNDGNSESEKGLIYSIDTWADQIIEFIEEIILKNYSCNIDDDEDGTKKVHLIGNSVGGHLSVLLASKRPDLIESICLLNATPVWGLNLFGWSGHLPPPLLPRMIGRYLFDRIRDIETIEKYLDAAYANRGAFDDTLMKQIRECTEGKGGHAAFASILYAPPATFPVAPNEPQGFYKNLAMLKCDVLLIFGKEDPWCTPAIAKKMYQSLSSRGNSAVHRYVELDNVGHCPNHEAPTAVGYIANRWMTSKDRSQQQLSLWGEQKAIDQWIVEEPWGTVIAREVNERDATLTRLERIIASFV